MVNSKNPLLSTSINVMKVSADMVSPLRISCLTSTLPVRKKTSVLMRCVDWKNVIL